MNGDATVFGVNFADGRIKGYPKFWPGTSTAKTCFVLYVRGNNSYGKNQFVDNSNGTISDKATGLMWLKYDSGYLKARTNKDGKLNWQQVLAWAEGLDYAGHSDWRLPNAKELQSIVDYTRAPDITQSAAIDPIFQITDYTDANGNTNYYFYWSSTTHKSSASTGTYACYVAFGEAQGYMSFAGSAYQLLDVHGAGAQRSDPKSGAPAAYPYGWGPQGDVIAIYNMVRPVRNE
ncbi:DUF1566 domain-containing protein [Candidatus Riflebacteria bacterium]